MMRRSRLTLIALLAAGSSPRAPRTRTSSTLAELRDVRPDTSEVQVEQGLDKAMESYRRFLEETPETAMTPEAMRRLADLQDREAVRDSGRRQAAWNWPRRSLRRSASRA